MYEFRKLILETINNSRDLNIEFMIDHGINPSVYTKGIPLYDPKTNGLVIVSGPDKNSPYFKENAKKERNKICFPDDKLTIKPIKEIRNQEGNYYTKEYDEPIAITVEDFVDSIYTNERNKDTLDDLTLVYVDTPEEQDTVKTQYFANREKEELQSEKEYDEWLKRNSSNLSEILDLNVSDTIKKDLLKKAYKSNKDGITIADISKHFVPWWLYQVENMNVMDLITKAIKKTNASKEDKKAKIEELKKELRNCFNQNMKQEDVLVHMVNWYKSKNESIDEAKPEPITNMHEMRHVLEDIGIDPKFITVPITIDAIGQGTFAKPEENVVIKRIEDRNNLDDKYGIIVVKDVNTNELKKMNIGELKKYAGNAFNSQKELDTVNYRLKAGNQFTTLNPGYARYIEIPEDILIQMLRTIKDENPEDYPFDLVQYYKDETLGKPNKIVLDALNSYNTINRNKVIRRFPNKQMNKYIYKGYVPYEDTGGKAKPAMSKKDYFKTAMDF